ncbi:MAG: DUF4843 domain-containing protein [Balneolaceae bacterium]|nr:DUF4843 domain-containing protein [Balneolaceae bacterium]
MKNSILVKIVTVIVASLFLSGCLNDLFEQENKRFQDNPKIEFRPLNQVVSDADVDDFDPSEPLKVQLIGEQRSSDLSVSFVVDEENSTAEAGTHYNLVTSSPITLPANASVTGPIEIEVIENSVPDGEVVELVLILQDADGVEAAENLKTYTLTIEGE